MARIQGAEIYATVSNEEKISYLMNEYQIPRDHIFSSRNTSFFDDVMRQTGGKGIDVALNSLSGELLHATWRCVAKWGTMVEIGIRDLVDAGKLDMEKFLGCRSYCSMEAVQMCEERPHMVST